MVCKGQHSTNGCGHTRARSQRELVGVTEYLVGLTTSRSAKTRLIFTHIQTITQPTGRTRQGNALQRFLDAQHPIYGQVRDELQAGQKETHWMWFIFPQIKGLGTSATAKNYAITGIKEAKAYLDHPLLGFRLRECTQLVRAISCCQPDLWSTDGTAAGTVQIDSNEGYPFHLQPSSLRPFGNQLALLTDAENTGTELSMVDSDTNALTILDLAPGAGSGASNGSTIAAMDGFILFLRGDPNDTVKDNQGAVSNVATVTLTVTAAAAV
jgi:Protein of unknown function (DUF1810)